MDAPAPTAYKPSVFYFRRALRESSGQERAVTVCLIVLSEYSQLREWSADQEVIPSLVYEPAAEYMRAAIVEATHAQAILLGLFLCHELEQLKAAVRDIGLIPPKWIVAPEEAEEKGWSPQSAQADA